MQNRKHNRTALMAMSAVLSLMLILTLLVPTSALAVTGSDVAVDGTYSTTITAKKSGESKTKTATLNVVVVDGLISDLTFSGSDAKDFKKYLMGEKGTEGMRYLDQKASANAVDAVTSATQGGAKYTIDLKGAIKTALAQADARAESGTQAPSSLEDGVYTKDFTAASKYNATVTVTVSGGKIASIAVSGDGDWSTPLSDAQSNLVGKNSLVGVDAISSATQYSQALEDAILAALAGESESSDPVLTTYTATVTAKKTGESKTKTATVNVVVSNGKISRISFTGGDYDDFEKYLKIAKTGSSKYNMSWYEALVGNALSEDLIVDATSSASLKNEATSSKYQTDLQQALLSALEPLLTQSAAAPEIKSGGNQTYKKSSGINITISSTADISLFKEVTVDGSTVNPSNYTVTSGSTVVEFNSNYLDTLATGDHSVGIVSTNGTATATLTVVAASETTEATDAGKTISPDGSATINVGETVTLDGTHNSMASSESWSSSDTSVATVAASGGSYDSDATVTGVSAGTATITHTISSLFGSSTETFTITVISSGSDSGSSGSGSGSNSGGSGSGTGGDTEPGDPAHVKSISPDGEAAESYTISLNVTGQSKTTTSTTETGESTTSPYDILLVLDNTRSMTSSYGNTTRLAAMKSAAQSFVNGLPTADGSKIAMISFTIGNYQSIVTTNVSWSDLSSSKSTVTSAISGLNAPDTGYDTYFTQPLQSASSLLTNVANDGNKKFVVFFTDGAAAESVSTIQSLASTVQSKADATFSIGIVSGNTETQKAQALASASGNYYDVTTAGTMSTAFSNALTTIQNQTTVTKLPMTGVSITDTLSDYVELSDSAESPYGVTLNASPADSSVSIKSVTVDGKAVTVEFSGNLTDDTVYTVSILVKPSEKAQEEANAGESHQSSFPSNSSATLTYQYGTEAAKSITYAETPTILVTKKVTLSYDANGGNNAPEAHEPTAVDTKTGKATFTISEIAPTREGYTFSGWADTADATDASYNASETILIDQNTTLYAVWQEIFTPDPDPIKITVTKDWGEFDATDYTVTIAAFNGETQIGEAIELNKDTWTGTITLDADAAYTTVKETKITDASGADVTDKFTSEAEKQGGGWAEAGNTPAAGTTYVIGFKSGSDVYVFSVSGTSIVSKKADVSDGKLTNITSAEQWAFTDTGNVSNSMTVWNVANEAGALNRNSSGLAIGTASNVRIYNGKFQAYNSSYRAYAAASGGIVYGNSAGDMTLYTPDSSGESWAVTNSPKEFKVTFNNNGHGTAPEYQTVAYNGTATRPKNLEESGWKFDGWYTDAACTEGKEYVFDTPVTEDITLYAKWTQNYRLIFEDYTGGGVNISGVEVTNLDGHANCKIGTTYFDGDVSFTLSADMAVVAAIHTDSAGMSYGKLMDENGTYTRLYCTSGHQFTVNISSGDVYVVLAYKGDLDLDGEVEIWDSTLANRIYIDTWKDVTNLKRLIGDVDSDGEIEIWDSTLINRVYLDTYTLLWDIR